MAMDIGMDSKVPKGAIDIQEFLVLMKNAETRSANSMNPETYFRKVRDLVERHLEWLAIKRELDAEIKDQRDD